MKYEQTRRSCLLFHYSKVFDAKLSTKENIIYCLKETTTNDNKKSVKEENVQFDTFDGRKCRLLKCAINNKKLFNCITKFPF